MRKLICQLLAFILCFVLPMAYSSPVIETTGKPLQIMDTIDENSVTDASKAGSTCSSVLKELSIPRSIVFKKVGRFDLSSLKVTDKVFYNLYEAQHPKTNERLLIKVSKVSPTQISRFGLSPAMSEYKILENKGMFLDFKVFPDQRAAFIFQNIPEGILLEDVLAKGLIKRENDFKFLANAIQKLVREDNRKRIYHPQLFSNAIVVNMKGDRGLFPTAKMIDYSFSKVAGLDSSLPKKQEIALYTILKSIRNSMNVRQPSQQGSSSLFYVQKLCQASPE